MKYLLIFSCLIMFSCSKTQFISGSYYSHSQPLQELRFEGKRFAYRDRYVSEHPIYYCSDTIAYGNWSIRKENELIELNSEGSQSRTLIDALVVESINTDVSNSSIKFIIENPIEVHSERLDGKSGPLEYGIKLEWISSNFNSGLDYYAEIISRRFTSNEILLDMPVGFKVNSFSIDVYQSKNGFWRNAHQGMARSGFYSIKDNKSNTFRVILPDVKYCYMDALIVNHEFVLIKNSTMLEWHGESFEKMK